MTPTARSKAHLETAGYLVEVVERWNAWARIRQDLWGFADLLAIRRGEVLVVQVTSRDNISKRVSKIAGSDKAPRVREAGIRIVVHGWGKMASGRWELKEVDCS
jgi:hypothetical protein